MADRVLTVELTDDMSLQEAVCAVIDTTCLANAQDRLIRPEEHHIADQLVAWIVAHPGESGSGGRLDALADVRRMFRGCELPDATTLIALADWVLTGTADIAHTATRVQAESYRQYHQRNRRSTLRSWLRRVRMWRS